jgi:hypothetical protein
LPQIFPCPIEAILQQIKLIFEENPGALFEALFLPYRHIFFGLSADF